jgi:hypothetical protein
LSAFGHGQRSTASHLTTMRTIWSEWTWAWKFPLRFSLVFECLWLLFRWSSLLSNCADNIVYLLYIVHILWINLFILFSFCRYSDLFEYLCIIAFQLSMIASYHRLLFNYCAYFQILILEICSRFLSIRK